MPEGPSLVLAREELVAFIGKKVVRASGRTKIDKESFENRKLLAVRTWGKHLLLQFKGFSVRIHFLMFGKYLINERKDAVPSLGLQFSKGEINFYTSAVTLIELPLDEVYDWSADVMSDAWDPRAAARKLRKQPLLNVADALLDQQIFSGVGNIIKNEVLYRIKVHPASVTGALPPHKLRQLVKEARQYSFDFLEWKRNFVLKKNWLAHTKKICARDGHPIIKQYIGKTARRSFFCEACQKIYS